MEGHTIETIESPHASETLDFCQWTIDVSEVSKYFEKVMVIYGELTTRDFSNEQRDDDTIVIHGEGYKFFLWYKPDLQRYYETKEYQDEMKKQDPQPRLPTKEDCYKNVLNLQDELKVFLVSNPDIIQGESTLPPPVPLSNGLLFTIAKKIENIKINYSILNDRYYQKCDLLFETLFRLIEDSFDVRIENKEDLDVLDHVEGDKNYCASNFYFEQTNANHYKIRNEGTIPDMDQIIFRERRIETEQKDKGIDLNLPVKNLKIYFEKTDRMDADGKRVDSGDKDHHMYFTMNFHLFFLNEYGPKADKEEAKIERIVEEIEKVYCINFGCEPDFDSGTELNFFRENVKMNPEHYMVVNYFKPSLVFEHYLLSQEDSKELSHEKERMLMGKDGSIGSRLLVV
jgi:hypothetical protein